MTSSVTRPTRRTLVKGAAWSVPVVAVAGAAPAFAASGGPPSVVVGGACKLPGNSCGDVFVKGYIFDVTITNGTTEPIYIYGDDIIITETNPDIDLFFQAAVDATTGDVITFPYLLEPGQSLVIVLNAGENGNSANQSLTGTIQVPWGHTPDPSDDTDHLPAVDGFSFASTPPVQNPGCTVTLPPNCGA
ncbi:hypothetical protein [Ornithinimicrobium cerasi]|uniref:Uncharacterized protein n=1 Tax=Ornithinimicrobium cerasi TaxID=2248773 RepID=A0A285VDV0_9MICO|nr:hypothetical protein [Ornithinimicrobium cerasi]SOC51728.1 hypothetical protein SAMN05421879_101290 [Ornithinimicrobium cerasi]